MDVCFAIHGNYLAFVFIQVHVVMADGEGLSDQFEEQMKSFTGVGEIEVLSMGLL